MRARNCWAGPGRVFSPPNRTMRLIITCPRPDSEALRERLGAMGHDVMVEPMLTIQTLAGAPLDLEDAAAVLLTSANGARALAQRTDARDLSVLAVGDATATAARVAGFRDVAVAGGDVVALTALVRLLIFPEN